VVLRSGLIVEVPEAEPAVSPWRSRLDPMAALGVAAHITVLFPFAPPSSIDEATREALRALFGAITVFDFRLVATRWFDQNVLWLAPDPSAPFRSLTRTVTEMFPAYLPYGGQFADVVPHLTIADHGPADTMHAAEQQLHTALPISSTARSVVLMTELPTGGWTRAERFPLGLR
jgi:2'-5' RNA ligase